MISNTRVQKYLICFVAIVVCIFYLLSLLGCVSTSPGLPGIYLVRLYNNATAAEVRVGLFGVCAGVGKGNLTCASTIGQNFTSSGSGTSTKYFLPGSSPGRQVAPTSLQALLAVALGVQSGSTGAGGVVAVIFAPLILGSLFFVAAVGSLLTHEAMAYKNGGYASDDGSNDGKMGSILAHKQRAWRSTGIMATYSVAAAVGAATASTVASRALQFAGTELPGSESSISSAGFVVSGGTSLQVLQWLIVAFSLLWHLLMVQVWRRLV